MSEPVTNVLMVGVGGQGIVLASDILAEAAAIAGHDVKKSEIHGMSRRGGPVFSHVRFGARVHSAVIPEGAAAVVLAMEPMELLRWAPWAAPGASACYLSTPILPVGVEEYPDDLEAEIEARNASRKDEDHVVPESNKKADLVAALEADDAAAESA